MNNTLLTNIRQALITETSKLYIPKYEVRDVAPETLQDVVSTYISTGKLIIWSGASDNTIFGDKASNWLFRAWHDYTHILTMGEFTPQGEAITALKQMSQVGSVFAEIIRIEVIEQVNYFEKYGVFPEDQLKFFKSMYDKNI